MKRLKKFIGFSKDIVSLVIHILKKELLTRKIKEAEKREVLKESNLTND